MTRAELEAEIKAEYGKFLGWAKNNTTVAMVVALALGLLVGHLL